MFILSRLLGLIFTAALALALMRPPGNSLLVHLQGGGSGGVGVGGGFSPRSPLQYGQLELPSVVHRLWRLALPPDLRLSASRPLLLPPPGGEDGFIFAEGNALRESLLTDNNCDSNPPLLQKQGKVSVRHPSEPQVNIAKRYSNSDNKNSGQPCGESELFLDIGRGFYPRHVRTVVCSEGSPGRDKRSEFSSGTPQNCCSIIPPGMECKERVGHETVLRRRREGEEEDYDNPQGEDTIPSELRRSWTWDTLEVNITCQLTRKTP